MTSNINGAHLSVGGAECPTYQRDAVPLGPFEKEPMDLRYLLTRRFDGTWRSIDEVRAASAAWILGALDGAGVDVDDYDRVAVSLLFEDCGIPAVQVIAGWIARARLPEHEPALTPDNGRASTARLIAALDHADVALDEYDRDLPGFLAEDCGTPAVRAVTGWLTRVRPPEQEPATALSDVG